MANVVMPAVLWLLLIGSVALIGCRQPEEIHRAHQEIITLRDTLRPGMSAAEIEATFKRIQPRYLRFVGAAWKSIRIDQAVPEGAAKEWVLWVALREGRAAAVRIRTTDSEHEHPPGAPEDLIWTEEDDGTPFKNPTNQR